MTRFDGASVVFRTDASLQIGSGHVVRCLTLATALAARGARCRFVCRAHQGHLREAIGRQGHHAVMLPLPPEPSAPQPSGPAHADWLGVEAADDAHQTLSALAGCPVDWLVVDHYALDASWEVELRGHVSRLMVIDDLADRPHECDLVLDQTLGRNRSEYAGRVPSGCHILAGPGYALLRPEFSEWRERSLQRRGAATVERVLVTMGGVDQPNATAEALKGLCCCDALRSHQVEIDVVMGATAPWLEDVRRQAASMPWPTRVHAGVANMAELMARCDLAIGAAGGTAWERCCLGLPSLLVVMADNQSVGARSLEASGAALVLGTVDEAAAALPAAVDRVVRTAGLSAMAAAAARIVDGGGVDRVLNEMVGLDG